MQFTDRKLSSLIGLDLISIDNCLRDMKDLIPLMRMKYEGEKDEKERRGLERNKGR